MNGPLNPNIMVGREYRANRPREEINADAMSAAQWADVWPDLFEFLCDPASAILHNSLEQRHFNGSDEDRAERAKRRKERAALNAEMRMERPR